MKYTEESARAYIRAVFEKLDVYEVCRLVEEETGAQIHISTIYRLVKGGSKPAFVIMLAYVLDRALNKQNN